MDGEVYSLCRPTTCRTRQLALQRQQKRRTKKSKMLKYWVLGWRLKKRWWQHRRVRENVPDGRSGETVHTQELPCRRKQTAAIRHSGGSINFEKRIKQCRHLSQIRTMNDMRFMREKATCWKMLRQTEGEEQLPSPPTPCLNLSLIRQPRKWEGNALRSWVRSMLLITIFIVSQARNQGGGVSVGSYDPPPTRSRWSVFLTCIPQARLSQFFFIV